MLRPPQRIVRAGLTLGAQSLSSVTNFAASALALGAGDLAAFGQFAIAFQLCQVVVAVGHGGIGDVVLIHASSERGTDRAARFRSGAATASLLTGLIATVAFALAALIDADLRTLLFISAIGAPAVVAQYTLRAQRFAEQDPAGVFRADAIWLGVVILGAVVDLLGWDATPAGYLVVWILGAAVSGFPTILEGLTTGRRQVGLYWETAGPQTVRISIESILARSAFVVSLIATEIVLDARASGALAAAVLLFSPMSVVHAAASAIVVPREIARGGIHIVDPMVPIVTAGIVIGITVAWASLIVAVDAFTSGAGPFDLTQNEIAVGLFVATFARFTGLAAWRGPLIALRIADNAEAALRARVIGTAAQWVLPVVGLVTAGLVGGATGLAVGACIGATDAWRRYYSARSDGS